MFPVAFYAAMGTQALEEVILHELDIPLLGRLARRALFLSGRTGCGTGGVKESTRSIAATVLIKENVFLATFTSGLLAYGSIITRAAANNGVREIALVTVVDSPANFGFTA